ncbi:MAG TPA: DNA-binding response regulator [Acidimicrobiia bacterium]|nr:DNA-binding response regulator [Acidimicrobiia bacterium]
MSTRVVALVDDLMDRSRLGVLGAVTWAASAEAAAELTGDGLPTTFVVDLTRFASQVAVLRDLAPTGLIVAFGPHVDASLLADAAAAGADRVLPRSRFFADPASALAPDRGSARA